MKDSQGHGNDLNYRGTEEQRFWRRVQKQHCGCWVWIGYRNDKGYGVFTLAKKLGDVVSKSKRAHVWSWEKVNGPVPRGLEIDHLCRNRACVNPQHMRAVTHLKNMQVGSHAMKTHCKHGHELSGQNVYYSGRQRVCRACDNARSKIRYRNKHQ